MTAPTAPRKPHSQTLHGHTRHDPYAWLRDPNWQEALKDPSVLDPEIRAALEAENAYCADQLADTQALQEALVAELRGRMDEDDSTVPAPDGPWAYYRRFEQGKEYAIHARRDADGQEHVLLDVNALAEGQAFCSVYGVRPSPGHGRFAFSADFKGSERYQLHVRDVGNEADVEVISDTGGGAVWLDDERFAWVEIDEHHRPKRLWLHRVGTPTAEDTLLYDEPDDGRFLWFERSESRRYLLMKSADHTASAVYALAIDAPEAGLRQLFEREPGRKLDVSHHGEHFVILVREGDRKDGRIVRMPVAGGDWEALVPYREGVLIEGIWLTERWLVRLETADALPRLVVRSFETGEEHTITFDEEAYALQLIGGLEWATDTLRFGYSSPTTPARVYDYDMQARTRALRKEQRIPSGHDPEAYRCERLMAPARDGETVPVTLLTRRDQPAGPAPTLLYGYGSYGYSMPASFSPHRLSLVDRGFTYAIAHIRGGKEKGYRWYEDAKQANKPRTFDDFIDVAEHLINEGRTTPDLLAAEGRSAGGMLIGAVANRAPDTFAALIAGVPFVDVLNTMCDATLPLTPPEWPEWGNPLEDPEAYATIGAYSPYENVAERPYPSIFAQAGLTDPRVTYWEPAKWIARLRHRTAGLQRPDRPILLDMEMDFGHAGASGRFQALKQVAMTYAYLLKVLKQPLA